MKELEGFFIKPIVRFLESEYSEKLKTYDLTVEGLIEVLIKKKVEVGVNCKSCGRKYPLYDLRHICDPLDQWLFDYTQGKELTELMPWEELILKARYKAGSHLTLYRGINASTADEVRTFEKMLNQGSGLVCPSYSSWTTDYETATRYARINPVNPESSAFDYRFKKFVKMLREEEDLVGEKGFVLRLESYSKEDVLVDLHDRSFGLYNESEVVLMPGTYSVSLVETFERKRAS